MFDFPGTVIKWVIFTKMFMSLLIFSGSLSSFPDIHSVVFWGNVTMLADSLLFPCSGVQGCLSPDWSRLLILCNPASFANFADSLGCWLALCCIIIFDAGRGDWLTGGFYSHWERCLSKTISKYIRANGGSDQILIQHEWGVTRGPSHRPPGDGTCASPAGQQAALE